MKEVIIDENYEGLINEGWRFVYNGDLDINCNLIINVKLFVKGDIYSKGYISSKGYIYSEGNIYSEGDIYSEGYISSKGYIYSEGYIYSKGYISSEGDIYSEGYIYSKGYISSEGDIFMMGIKTSLLAIINGKFGFKIWVMDNHLKIGCQFKSKEDWLKILESDHAKELASKIGDDGTMWENRAFIEMLCKG